MVLVLVLVLAGGRYGKARARARAERAVALVAALFHRRAAGSSGRRAADAEQQQGPARWGREGLEIIAYRGDPCRHCADRRPRQRALNYSDRSTSCARGIGLQAIDSSR